MNEGASVHDALVEHLFQIFFMDGKNIGNHKVLIKAAEHAGMDGSIVTALLATNKDRDKVEQALLYR